MSEYGKVIVGEPVDDTTPLLATGYTIEPNAAHAVPMYFRSVYVHIYKYVYLIYIYMCTKIFYVFYIYKYMNL